VENDESAVWRAQAYALLANLLAASPDSDLLTNIAALQVTNEGSELETGWQALIAAAAKADATPLKSEYQKVFIGLAQGEVIPYGSYYQTGFLHEKPLALLRADLALLGLSRQQEKKEPEDHIAAQCDVMRLLLSASGTPIVTAEVFFNRHLAPWAEKFFGDLQTADSATFYGAVGQFGKAFIQHEKQLMPKISA